MSFMDRDCSLTLYELKITLGMEYDRVSGSIIGDVTLPQHIGKATHGLVFMPAGKLACFWKGAEIILVRDSCHDIT